jgi:hypothetical protein
MRDRPDDPDVTRKKNTKDAATQGSRRTSAISLSSTATVTGPNHQVVRVTHHRHPLHGQVMVQRVEIAVTEQRAEHRPLGRPCLGRPLLQAVQDALFPKRCAQGQHAPVRHLLANPSHQLVVGYRVEVAFQVRIHDSGITQLPRY